MLYSRGGASFRQHVHPRLQQRIRIFIIMGGIMLLIVLRDLAEGLLSLPLAALGVAVGAAVGFASSRIFHLSWSRNGSRVVGRIDKIGAAVLGLYILFEVVRATLFEAVIHTASSTTAITFAFVAAALIGRVLGLRGRILRILKEERVFA